MADHPNDRSNVIRSVTSGFGFFSSALLILESALTVSLTFGDLTEEQTDLVLWFMIGSFVAICVYVGAVVWIDREKLGDVRREMKVIRETIESDKLQAAIRNTLSEALSDDEYREAHDIPRRTGDS